MNKFKNTKSDIPNSIKEFAKQERKLTIGKMV